MKYFAILLLLFFASCRELVIEDPFVESGFCSCACYADSALLTYESFYGDTLYFEKNASAAFKTEASVYWYADDDKIKITSKLIKDTLRLTLKRLNTFELPKEKCWRNLFLTFSDTTGVKYLKIDSLLYVIGKSQPEK